MKGLLITLLAFLMMFPLAFAYGDITAGPVDIDSSRISGNFYQSCSGDGWGHANGAYTNSHNTITIRVYSPTAKSNVYLIFYGNFDYGQTKESMTATMNGVSRTFNEPGDIGGWNEFTIGPFNLRAGNNDIVLKGAYWHDSQDCPSSSASGSIHFSNGGWVKTRESAQSNCIGPDGATIASGSSRTYYLTSTVPYGQICAAQTRTCNNGVLSGSYTYNSCAPQNPNSCIGPDGRTIPSGTSVTYYLSSNPPYGQSCYSQTRTCTNGVLSGSYTAATCTPQNPISCVGPDGATIASGSSRTYYSTSTVSGNQVCISENRVCNNGYLSGSFIFASCYVQPNSCTGPDGVVIPSGSGRTYYYTSSVPYGQSCNSQTRICTNGVLSGSYTAAACTPQNPLDCTGPDGSSILHGQSRNYYLSYSVPFGQSCSVEARTCNNGVLSGSYAAASCSVQPGNNCIGPDGATIPNGQSQTYYFTSTVPYGQICSAQSRVCTNGILSGSYTFNSCTPQNPNSCIGPDGTIIPNGFNRVYYYTSSVPYGQTCSAETRACSNGVLSGSYTSASCYIQNATSCIGPDGTVIPNGVSRIYYATPSAGVCSSELRICSNGILSGTFQYATCSLTDTQSPIVEIQSPINTTYSITQISLNYTAFDNQAVSACWVYIDGINHGILPMCMNATIIGLSQGQHSVTVYANDTSGNIGSDSVVFTISNTPTDNQAPIVDIQIPQNVTYTNTTLPLRYTAFDNIAVQSCWYTINGGSTVALPSCQNITLPTFLLTGTYTIRVYANDAVGNIGNDAVTFTITSGGSTDTQPPVVDIQSPLNTTYATSTVQLSYTAFDDVAIDSCWFVIDGVNYIPSSVCGNTSVAGLSLGTHRIIVYGRDTSGNVANDSVSFTVIATPINDTQAPVVTIFSPLNITYNQSTVPLNYIATDDIAVTNCWYTINGGSTVNIGLQNRTLTNVDGTFTVVVSCTDAAGNVGSANVTYTNIFVQRVPIFADIDTKVRERKISVIDFDTIQDGDFKSGETKMYLRFKNTGDVDLSDLTVTISIPELNAWTKLGPFNDLDSGKTIDRIALLDIEDAKPGYYYARLSFTSKEYTKAIWYEVKVE